MLEVVVEGQAVDAGSGGGRQVVGVDGGDLHRVRVQVRVPGEVAVTVVAHLIDEGTVGIYAFKYSCADRLILPICRCVVSALILTCFVHHLSTLHFLFRNINILPLPCVPLTAHDIGRKHILAALSHLRFYEDNMLKLNGC